MESNIQSERSISMLTAAEINLDVDWRHVITTEQSIITPKAWNQLTYLKQNDAKVRTKRILF